MRSPAGDPTRRAEQTVDERTRTPRTQKAARAAMTADLSPDWQYLLSPAGTEQLSALALRLESGRTLHEIGAELRKQGFPAELVAPVLSQAELQRKAVTKFGELAAQLRFTPAGLEQATRSTVARRHAARFAQSGVRQVADLGCGIGAESLQFVAAGLAVLPVEIDTLTAQIAQFNLNVAAQHVRATPAPTVHLGPAEDASLPADAAVFLDPARRTAGHRNTTRLTSPDDYTPSLGFAFGLGTERPTGIKLGPGFDRELIPAQAEAQWISVDHQVVETGLWFGQLARPGIRRSALVVTGDTHAELVSAADAPDAEVGDLGEYIYEPDGAVIRARLIGQLATDLSATMLSPGIAYLTADTLTHTPFAAAFRLREILPSNEKQLKRALRERQIGSLEIKKRGVDVDPAQLRSRLKLQGSERATLIMTRVAGKHRALLVERCEAPRS